jgi:hypothetical protein
MEKIMELNIGWLKTVGEKIGERMDMLEFLEKILEMLLVFVLLPPLLHFPIFKF